MILQAYEYEKRDNAPKKLEEFFKATYGKFNHPFIQDLAKELYKQREEFEKKALLNGNVQYYFCFIGIKHFIYLVSLVLECGTFQMYP